MKENNFKNAKILIIDKETGERHVHCGPIEITHYSCPVFGIDALPSGLESMKDYSFNLSIKISKRKARKLIYTMNHLSGPHPQKYISKRDVLDGIIKDFVDTGIIQMLNPYEYYLRKFSHKQLTELREEICRIRHHLFEVSPPVPNGEDDKEYFRDPFEVVIPDCGDRNGVVIDTGNYEPV